MPIEDRVGDYVNKITFVEDYVQIGFNNIILTAIANPIVEYEGSQWRFPQPGSRDALCSLIRQVVSKIDIDTNRYVRLMFDKGYILTIPLDEMNRGSEALLYDAGPDWNVW